MSAQAQDELAIRDAQSRLHSALASGGIGTWVWDVQEDDVWWDESTSELLGRNPESLNTEVVEKFVACLHQDDRAHVRQALRDCKLHGTEYEVEYRVLRPDGTMKWIAARGRMQCDPDGIPWRLTGACVDITGRKRAEEEREIYALELEQSNRDLQQFAYVASHDLREPLRMITNYSQLLTEDYGDKLDETGRKYLAYALDGAQRLSLLIEDLLDYARVGRNETPLETLNLKLLVDDVLMDLEETIKDSQASVETASLPPVLGNRIRLRQVFQNLIGNALEFCPERNATVHIGCVPGKMLHEFSISDNGIGIDPKYHERIFQVFQRLNSREQFSGNGIGLSVCKKIIEQHGGRIWVQSAAGEGSTFRFTLRAAQLS